MNTFLFDEFKGTTPTAWKQKIQADLNGADYNETLLWKTNEGITIKPFYTKEDRNNLQIQLPKEDFRVCQTILITDEKQANQLALDSLQRGATAIQFLASKKFDYQVLLKKINLKKTLIYFKFEFLDDDFITKVVQFTNSKTCYFQLDIIGNLAETGNWFINLKEDHKKLENIVKSAENCICISGDLYQNSGANIIQQLAYSLAHANEYFNYFGAEISKKIHFKFSVGGNYFHEVAKLRAFRLLWSSLLTIYETEDFEAHIFVEPSTRNKTLYDYNVNMLRTTSECMSAILGSANTISNNSYDAIYADANEFGERISRNQLLILKEESGFIDAQKFSNGSYYIDALTNQFAEQALLIFKQLENGGGFLHQLKEGNIQRKIKESAQKEENQFLEKKLILLGSNLQPVKNEVIKNNLQKDPFVKQRNIKTIVPPIIRKRISENLEKQRFRNEKS